jgi:hypothetical protein
LSVLSLVRPPIIIAYGAAGAIATAMRIIISVWGSGVLPLPSPPMAERWSPKGHQRRGMRLPLRGTWRDGGADFVKQINTARLARLAPATGEH